MAMRDRIPLDKIELPKDQERIMDVVCKAWDECDESECKGCIDRKSHFMSIRECVAIKASRMLVEEGYARVVHAEWIPTNTPSFFGGFLYKCSECGATDREHSSILGTYCWRCGAKMDGEITEETP